jgi:hypothetical protein
MINFSLISALKFYNYLSSKFQVKNKIFIISYFLGGWLVCAQADPFPTKRPEKNAGAIILRLVDFFYIKKCASKWEKIF